MVRLKNVINWSSLNCIFKCLCIVAAFFLVGMWIHRYYLDEDTSVIENVSYFQSKDDTFPILSLCFKQSFTDQMFSSLPYNVTGANYMKYLEGEYFDENMLHVDYDEVSTNISDFVLSYDLDLMNGTLLTNVRSEVFFRYPYVTYNWISLGNVVKCFGFEITNSNVKTMRINLNRDIFPARIRPSDGGFAMLLHYSNQVTWSYRTVRRIWPSHDKTSNFKLGMILKGMTVYVQRYKYRLNNCIWNWKQYDQITVQNHINKINLFEMGKFPANFLHLLSSAKRHQIKTKAF